MKIMEKVWKQKINGNLYAITKTYKKYYNSIHNMNVLRR